MPNRTKLSEIMVEKKLTNSQLAEITAIPKRTIDCYRMGSADLRRAGVGRILALAKALDVNVGYLVGEDNVRTSYSADRNDLAGCLSDDERHLINSFRQLNIGDRNVVMQYIAFLLNKPRA